MEKRRFLPIGIQTFSKLRERNAVYVDKTDLVYRLAQDGEVYFLSRPRRFGKSLLLSTLHAYFAGEKDLFAGLALENLEKKWTKHPVLHFDMSRAKHTEVEGLNEVLNILLHEYEVKYECENSMKKFSLRLAELIQRAHEQTGQKVVLLIDEYDTPLLDTLVNDKTLEQMRLVLRDFFSPIKAMDAHLRFVFLTGITKFSQLSIFSELNSLKNISMFDAYAALCGIAEEELHRDFAPEIERMAEVNHWSHEETIARLKKRYDGYHFCETSPDIYNPFSVLNSLSENKLGYYWFSSGTPTALAEQIDKYHALEPMDLDRGIWVPQSAFDVPIEQADSPIPLMYQSGYLSIKKYNPKKNTYLLAYPNEEVMFGFTQCLLPNYVHKSLSESKIFLLKFSDALDEGDVDTALNLTRAFLSSIPYAATKLDENFYRTVIYLLCRVLTPFVTSCEQMSAAGRADLVVETDDAVYCFEFKLNDTPQAALKQIDDKGYLVPYSVNGKQLVKVGVCFDGDKRTLGDWIVVKE